MQELHIIYRGPLSVGAHNCLQGLIIVCMSYLSVRAPNCLYIGPLSVWTLFSRGTLSARAPNRLQVSLIVYRGSKLFVRALCLQELHNVFRVPFSVGAPCLYKLLVREDPLFVQRPFMCRGPFLQRSLVCIFF